jgi:peptide-methionine (S)-S-oxide reductase
MRTILVLFGSLLLVGLPLTATEPEKATLGAGCFWCVEAIYEQFPGVLDVVSGYAGGNEPDPSYKQVSAGRTSHAEVVQITFDPDVTSYRAIIDYFWKTHDVTDPRGVWPDFGPQYRSIILAHNEEQLVAARESRNEARQNHDKPIATQIVSLDVFYPAESYHQDFVRRNPNHSYVRRIAYKKLDKLGLKHP